MTSSRYYRPVISFGGPLTRAVKGLIIANVVFFVIRFVAERFGGAPFDQTFGLVPLLVTRQFALWQFVTYLFVHEGVFHILFNMLMLWMFGGDLERLWGYKKFLQYYFLTGVGAGFCSYVVAPLAPTITIGASGAIFGVLLAYGVLFADRLIYLYFLFPIKAKYFVMIMGAIEFYSALVSSGSGISNTAHLGGMIFGFLYLKRHGFSLELRSLWQRWKLHQARRKFQVYMQRHEDEHRGSHEKGIDKKTMIQ
jgi:membrane associated rhomboid family serine protease